MGAWGRDYLERKNAGTEFCSKKIQEGSQEEKQARTQPFNAEKDRQIPREIKGKWEPEY